jgi:hypothetical protein
MEVVRIAGPDSRMKCILCGNDFVKSKKSIDERGEETIGVDDLLANFSRMALEQGNRIKSQSQTLTSSIADRI